MNPTTKLKSALATTGLNLMSWSASYSKLRAAVEEVIGEMDGEAESAEELFKQLRWCLVLGIEKRNPVATWDSEKAIELIRARDARLLSRAAPAVVWRTDSIDALGPVHIAIAVVESDDALSRVTALIREVGSGDSDWLEELATGAIIDPGRVKRWYEVLQPLPEGIDLGELKRQPPTKAEGT